MKFKNSFLVILLLSILSTAFGQNNTQLSKELIDNISNRVENGLNPGIAIAIIDESGIQYHSFGVKSLKSQEPVDQYSIFEIGSISKAFTGIILADMSLKGTLNLDDPLQSLLPEGIKAPTRNDQSIRLFQMSNHTSSLPRLPMNMSPKDPSNPYSDYNETQLFSFIDNYKLTRDIGSEYEYSNYAVGLLGTVLAKKMNTTYEQLMIKTITIPLKMRNTRINFTDEMKANLAAGHSGSIQVANWDLPTLAGAGAIRSSTVDMATFIAANMGIEKTELYPALQLSHKNSRVDGSTPIVGLGWHTSEFEDIQVVWHNGGTGGYRAFAGFVKDGNKGVVVLTNSNVSIDDIGIHILNPNQPLTDVKPSVAAELKTQIGKSGTKGLLDFYNNLKTNQADQLNFEEQELNNLGYFYLGREEFSTAIEVFKVNVNAFPQSSNVYDSLGEAYLKDGQKDKAVTNYSKSVELNPGNQTGIQQLKDLGINPEDIIKEIVVDEATLQSYVGKYEIAPSFHLDVTLEDGQLWTQATGQMRFPVYPKSKTEFYLKIVEASLKFNVEVDKVTSLTLFQGGQEILGKRIEK